MVYTNLTIADQLLSTYKNNMTDLIHAILNHGGLKSYIGDYDENTYEVYSFKAYFNDGSNITI
jgi:hypothetical protein